jgi:hypothetical protein
MRGLVRTYRITVFRRPIGPWRKTLEHARRDAIEHDAGSYDEWGRFYLNCYAQLCVHYEWGELPDPKRPPLMVDTPTRRSDPQPRLARSPAGSADARRLRSRASTWQG